MNPPTAYEYTVGAMVGRSRWNCIVYSYPLARLRLEKRKISLSMYKYIVIENSDAIRIEMRGKRFTWIRILGDCNYPYIRVFLPVRSDRVATALLDAGFASLRSARN